MFVPTTDNTAKRHKMYCKYCQKFQSKFVRHLEAGYSDVAEVKKFRFLAKECKETKQIIDTIRKYCKFYFNTHDQINDGELLVTRRPGKNVKRQACDYVACYQCKGFHTKNNIRLHAQNCFGYTLKNRSVVIMGRTIVGRIRPEGSRILKNKIFPVKGKTTS